MGNGLFMPDHYEHIKITLTDVKLVSIAWGWLLGFTFLTAVKAGTQTLQISRRVGRITPYVLMIWLEIAVCSILGLICWLFMHGSIQEGFAFYFVGTTLRCAIVQLILQIVVSRISILITSPQRKTFLKWAPFTLILLLNAGVYCVWIPAHLQISRTYIEINRYYSRCEKVTYTLVDVALNIYFCHLIKSRLVNAGMAKYRVLYRFNLCLIMVNLSMDVLLIGLMSLPNQLVYVQFFPLTYMVKLNIEMSMAETIAKVARSRHEVRHRNTAPHNDSLGHNSSRLESSDSSVANDRPPAGVKTGSFLAEKKRDLHGSINQPILRDDLPNGNAFVDHNLYHAWISGGMSSQAHLALDEFGQRQQSGSQVVESGSNLNGATRPDTHVIIKNTIVQVRAEDA